jgi:hypothetical protein
LEGTISRGIADVLVPLDGDATFSYSQDVGVPASWRQEMKHLELTEHASIRCQQRGVDQATALLIMQYGTDTGDGWLLTKQDCEECISEFKAQIQQLDKLKHKEVFIPHAGHRAKTVYPTSKKKRQSIRQHGGFR